MRKNKLFTGIMSITCAAALLITGTMALTGSAFTLPNLFVSDKDNPTPPGPTPPTIVDVYDPTYANGTVNKDIYVQNTSSSTIYVRVKLQETLTMGTTTPAETELNWKDHVPVQDPADCSHTAHDELFTWIMGDVDIGVNVDHKDTGVTGYWMFDDDGYAYWSEPLESGKQTDKLLDAVQVHKYGEETYHYAIRGYMEWITAEDMEQWLGTGKGTSGDEKTFDQNGDPITGVTRAPIVGQDIKDHFSGVKPEKPSKYTYTLMMTGGVPVGESPIDYLSISYTTDLSDMPVIVQPANLTDLKANPATVDADTKEVTFTFTSAAGTPITETLPIKVIASGEASYVADIEIPVLGDGDTIKDHTAVNVTKTENGKEETKAATVVSTDPEIAKAGGNLTIMYITVTYINPFTGEQETSGFVDISVAPKVVTYSDPTVTTSKKDPAVGDSTTDGVSITVKGSDGKTYPATVTGATPEKFAADTKEITFTYTNPDGTAGSVKKTLAELGITLSNPTEGLVQDDEGNYYRQCENPHVYEKTDAKGNGTGTYIYDTDHTLDDGGSKSADKFQEVGYFPDVTVVIPGNAFDPEITVGTKYYLHHSETSAIWIPIYPTGVNYMQCFHQGVDNTVGGGDEAAVGILAKDRTVSAADQDNWQTR